MYRVEYTYSHDVQRALDLLDEMIEQERESLNKSIELTEKYKGELWAFNIQQVIENYENTVAPLREAKGRILNNALPLKITIIKD